MNTKAKAIRVALITFCLGWSASVVFADNGQTITCSYIGTDSNNQQYCYDTSGNTYPATCNMSTGLCTAAVTPQPQTSPASDTTPPPVATQSTPATAPLPTQTPTQGPSTMDDIQQGAGLVKTGAQLYQQAGTAGTSAGTSGGAAAAPAAGWGSLLGWVGVIGGLAAAGYSAYGLVSALQSGNNGAAAMAAAGVVAGAAAAGAAAASGAAGATAASAAGAVTGAVSSAVTGSATAMTAALGPVLAAAAAFAIVAIIIVIVIVIIMLLLSGSKKPKAQSISHGDPSTSPPKWASSPQNVIVMTSGAALIALGFQTGPNANLIQAKQSQFDIPTLQALLQQNSPAGTILPKNPINDVFIVKGANGGYDQALILNPDPQKKGVDDVELVTLNPNGNFIPMQSPNAPPSTPATAYIPFYRLNPNNGPASLRPDARQAIHVQNSFLAVAQSPAVSPTDQQAAIKFAGEVNKALWGGNAGQ